MTGAAPTPCPSCGRLTERWINRSTQGAYCPACQRWDWVTTYLPPILDDRTVYRVGLMPNASPTAAQVRAVARVGGGNFPQAKRTLAEGSGTLFQGDAQAVLPVLATLDGAGVAHTVEPPFRWTAADTPEVVMAAGPRRARRPS
jgi:hypothetical protein